MNELRNKHLRNLARYTTYNSIKEEPVKTLLTLLFQPVTMTPRTAK